MTEPSHTNVEEAARWFARRRRGVMSLDEEAAFEIWQRNPQNLRAMAEFENLWSLIEAAVPAWKSRRHPACGRFMTLRWSAMVAVLCLASLGLGLVSYSADSKFWTELDWVQR